MQSEFSFRYFIGGYVMSGRKCERCRKVDSGVCPFGNRCQYEVWELYSKDMIERNRSKNSIDGGDSHESTLQ
jgi:hypothetical protein